MISRHFKTFLNCIETNRGLRHWRLNTRSKKKNFQFESATTCTVRVSFDFRSREFGNVKVNHIVRKKIKWDVAKLKKKLSPELYAELVEKEYYISDMHGLVKYLKSCGVDPKKFKKYLIVTEKVNQKKMDELSEIGDITAEDIEGCYKLKEANGYLTINVKKDEGNE